MTFVGGVADSIERATAESQFSGVVRVDRHGDTDYAKAFGFAHRGYGIPNTVTTQFGLASGAKGLTALTVMTLVADGQLRLDTTARSILGSDLPLIADQVTIEHLLAHRSGIGDYLDEDELDDVSDYVMPVPVHELATTEAYLRVLDGHPTKFRAGEQFSYNNGGYVVLALIAERVAGVAFSDLVRERVCNPAGMNDTAFLRSDEPDGRAATGYLDAESHRTNVLHLPVRGSGDGGVFSTAGDIHRLWDAFFAGGIVPRELVAEMVRPRSEVSKLHPYGLGLWLEVDSDVVALTGYDAGASFRSVRAPDGRFTYTVLSNTSEGAGPIAQVLNELTAALR